ncbi:inositol monophosphatase family protein [Fodinicola acaciae]|uniref:inositol monophosphatase family protein n=1 Tax=Fodinicola acaciae TaxID=2681555 RepID=UPI0013D3782C|nr:inositol monophosphatase [Fodinicola acaciae]
MSDRELLAAASEILDGAVAEFTGQLGAQASVHKSAKDFATEADLSIERHLTAALTERTGIPVHGEEHGGPPLDTGTTWVLDPIDGTANFSLGLPLTGTNLALVRDGRPVIGLTWAPLLHERYAATADGPVLRNGEPVPALQRAKLADVAIAFGNVTANGGRRFPTRWRMALLDTLAERSLRVRVLGSTAVEAAWTAAGVTGGMVAFGNHPWDTFPGACMIRAAGGVVTDVDGSEHSLSSRGMLAGASGVHEELLDALAAVGAPADYLD